MDLNASILELVISAKDLASETLARVNAEVAATGDTALASAEKSKAGMGSMLAPIAAVGIAAGVAAIATGKMAMDFQQQMTRLQTLGGLSAQMVQSLNAPILQMAGQVGIGPEKLAEAMYHIASNSKGVLTAAQMLDQLRMSAEAASISGANLDDTTYALSSAMATGIKGAKDAAEMMGVLTATVGAGDMKFQDLNAAIGSGFFSTAAQFGISVQSVGAALATLTDNGMHADEAATRLRMSISLMDAPSSQAAKVLNALGLSGAEVKAATAAATEELAKAHVTTTQLAEDMRKPNGINVAMEDLRDHLEKSGLSADAADAAIAKAFGGGRSDAAILTLLNNIKRTDESFAMITANSGKFAETWATQQATANQRLKDALAWMQAIAIEIGSHVLVAVFASIDAVTRLWAAFMANPGVRAGLVLIGSALREVWTVVQTQLGPALRQLWPQVEPLVKLLAQTLGVALVFALVAVLKALTFTLEALSAFIRLISSVISWVGQAGQAAGQFKINWAEAIGYVIGFFATLPIKLPFLISEAVIGMVNQIAKVNWGAVFSVLTAGFRFNVDLMSRAITDLINWLTHINWAGVGAQIGRDMGSAITGALRGAVAGIPGGSAALHALNIPGFASGVQGFGGGLAVVGERGPEIVNLPPGSSVYSNSDSQRMAGGVSLTVNVGTFTGTSAEFDMLAAKIYQSLMRTARANGTQLPAIGVRPA